MAETAIQIQDLTVRFAGRRGAGTTTALDRVSLAVEAGHVLGFIGPNGAGKTTALQVILGFLPPTSGSVRVYGEDVRRSIARQRIGYMPEWPGFPSCLTARELLIAFGRLFGLRTVELGERADRLLEEVGLTSASRRWIGTYSRGMLQRLGLAQALINNPDLVILDEPTSGLDPLGRAEVRALIERLRARGCTVFFSSHELSEVERVCDSIALLADGRIIAQGPPDALKEDPGESLEQFFLRKIESARAAPEASRP